MNKKAQLELSAIVPMFLAIGGMVLVFLVLFLLISSIRGCEPDPVSPRPTEMLAIDANYALVQFLRAPVHELTVDGRELTVAEALPFVFGEAEEGEVAGLRCVGPNCRILERIASAIFSLQFDDTWELRITFYSQDAVRRTATLKRTPGQLQRSLASATLPFPFGQEEGIQKIDVALVGAP